MTDGTLGNAPPVGRRVARRALQDVRGDGSLEFGTEADALRHRRVGGHVGEQLIDGLVLGPAPALQARPVHRAGDDPFALRADLEEDAQLVRHALRLRHGPIGDSWAAWPASRGRAGVGLPTLKERPPGSSGGPSFGGCDHAGRRTIA